MLYRKSLLRCRNVLYREKRGGEGKEGKRHTKEIKSDVSLLHRDGLINPSPLSCIESLCFDTKACSIADRIEERRGREEGKDTYTKGQISDVSLLYIGMD